MDNANNRLESPLPPQTQQGQRLPNECLYLIVKCLCRDLPTLHTLLFVNKFFFHATVPHLYDDPIIAWDITGLSPKYRTNRNQLFALFFVSFLQARLEELQWDSNDDLEANRILDGVLKQYGLRLSVPFQSSVINMLDDISSRAIDHHVHCDNINKPRKKPSLKITVNYSKFFSDFSTDWRCAQFPNMVQLRKLPEIMLGSRRSSDNALARNESINNDCDDNERHSIRQQLELPYTSQVFKAFEQMWSHYHLDSITYIDIDMSKGQNYLPLASKMANLQLINLSWKEEITESHFESIIQFIKQNQEAFPNKHILDVNLTERRYFHSDGHHSALMDLETYLAMRREFREKGFQRMRPLLSIYGATRKPRKMDVTNIPNFYEHAAEIEPEVLEMFKDHDMGRAMHGEGPKREEFLRKCNNLKELHLAVDSHESLSWAADEARQLPSSSAVGSLRKLETLRLSTNHSYNSAIQVFNDAMYAFSTTLQSINLCASEEYTLNDAPIAIKNIRTLEALQLHQRTSATSIGEWPCILLWLRSISVRLEGVASVKVGSFTQCPNLESLIFELGCKEVAQCRPEGTAPSSLPEAGILLDPRWAQAETDYTTFPLWNLPKLEQLVLRGMAALRFDIRSLTSMQRLEYLTLESEQNLDEYISRQCSASIETHPTLPNHNSEQASGIVSSESTSTKEQPKLHMLLYPIWHLSKLVKLELYGLAALKFNFESLPMMPSLEILQLDTKRESLSRRELEKYIYHQYAIPSSQPHDSTNHKPGSTYGIFGSDPTKAWVLPELRTITLKGPPSALFFLDLLKSFPKLESISLSSGGDMSGSVRRRITRRDASVRQSNFQVDEMVRTLSLLPYDELRDANDDKPYLISRLKFFKISGGWTIESQDITALLTVYAPFLEILSISRYFFSRTSFFQAIKDADDINQAYANMEDTRDENSSEKRSKRSLPGRNLRTIKCPCTILESEQRMFELREITNSDAAVFKYYNLRICHIGSMNMVRQVDYDLFKRYFNHES